MPDFRSEVLKALPNLPDETVNQVLMQLHRLGVENPQDMTLVEERDLASVLKVIQCRKLFNHFKDAFGKDQNTWIFNPPVINNPLPISQPYSQISTTSIDVKPEYASPYKDPPKQIGIPKTSFVSNDAHSSCVQTEPKSIFPVQNRTLMTNGGFSTFTVSPGYTISNPSSASEKHDSELQNFVTSTDSYVPFPLECELREITPATSGRSAENVTTLQATTSINHQNPSDYDSFCEDSSASCETSCDNTTNEKRSARRSSASCQTSTYKKRNICKSWIPFSDYKLPLCKLSTEILSLLENKVQIQKPFSRELVRVIVDDAMEESPYLKQSEMSMIAKAVVDAYPESLSNFTCGKNTPSGHESLLSMIQNRFRNVKYRGCAFSKRPKSRISERKEESKSAVSQAYNSSSFGKERVMLERLIGELEKRTSKPKTY